jgi:hypothetical protein
MNERLRSEIQSMSQERMQQMIDNLQSRPMLKKLFEAYRFNDSKKIDSAELIKAVYMNDGTAYSVLRNRFFKLRKELSELLGNSSFQLQNPAFMTTEEQQYLSFRHAVISGHGKDVIQDLKKFEKHLRQLNIFELWPSCLQLIIYYNQINNQLEDNKKYYYLLQQATEAQYELNRIIAAGRQIYEYNFHRALQDAGAQFEMLKRIALKYKQFPRFSLCYHYLSMYYKMGSNLYTDKSHVTARHLNRVRKLRLKHPNMPIMQFLPEYVEKLNYHILEVQAFYYYNSLKFNKSMDLYEELTILNGVQQSPKNEAQLLNLITISIAAERFDAAMHYINVLEAFFATNNIHDRSAELNVYRLKVEAESFGLVDSSFKEKRRDFLKKFVSTSQNENKADLLSSAILTLLKFNIIRNDYEAAERMLRQQFFQTAPNGGAIKEMFQLLISFLTRTVNLELMHERFVISSIQKIFRENISPTMAIERNWIIRFIEQKK